MNTLSFLLVGVVIGVIATGISTLVVEGLARLAEAILRRLAGPSTHGR